MIGDKCKKLFTRWILSEKETPTWTIIYYEVKNIIKLESNELWAVSFVLWLWYKFVRDTFYSLTEE